MEQHQQHQPRFCQEAEFMKVVRPGPADSPPPNCAICLGVCTNKCFTDCCLHQFCFSCLLEWSKIKAECPLCKQPFKSIIYNIKSNLEYEEHIITNPELILPNEREVQGEDLLLDEDVHTEYLFLPNGPRPQRHFQYRTTFTLEPGGEFAIQQLLLSHPRTNSLYIPTDRYHPSRFSQHSIHHRRNVYTESLWVESLPDITGRYRECSPSFFRENPAQIHRIVPWLNRELSALLIDYLEISVLQERILEMLCHYSIQSASFRNNILASLGNRSDHFIHEFYNYVRSPYDIIGYDRHATYTRRPHLLESQSISDDDSDVRVVDSPPNDDCIYIPPRTPEVIVINSDSDAEVMRSLPPLPTHSPPLVVNLIDSDSDDNVVVSSQQPIAENNHRETSRSPILPIKIRYKRNRNSAEIINDKKHKDKKNGRIGFYYTHSGSDSDSSRPKSDSEYSTAHISSTSSLSSTSSSSDSDSTSSSSSAAIANKIKKLRSTVLRQLKTKSRTRKNSYKTYKTSKCRNKQSLNSAKNKKSSKQKKYKKRKHSPSNYSQKCKRTKRIKVERCNSSSSEEDSRGSSSEDEDYSRKTKFLSDIKTETNTNEDQPETKQEIDSVPMKMSEYTTDHDNFECDQSQNLDVAGPSQGPTLRSVIVRGNNKWYSRPELEDTTTDNNSD